MRKILIVGGGVNQKSLVLASKHEGYYTIVVDYAGEKCPTYKIADRFYNVSTQDEEAIYEVAKIEDIDGIISNSEPSMLIVNNIAEKLGLNGNSAKGIKNLISKCRFRDLQRRVGVYAPNHFETKTVEEALSVSERLCYPIIVKPSESSASRGCKVIEQFDREIVTKAFLDCQQLSRDQKVVVEEFVEMPSLRTIEGDIFLYGGEILWKGLYYTTRPSWAPMIPMTYTGPMLVEDNKLDSIKTTITKVFNEENIRFGEFNIEGFFTSSGEFFIIEINVRQGGNFLPIFLQRFTGIDYNRLLVTTCVGDDYYWNSILATPRNYRYVILNSVYSPTEGVYKGLRLDSSIKDNIRDVKELLSIGDKVEKCVDGTSIIASVMLEFDNVEELYYVTPKVIDSIHVELS